MMVIVARLTDAKMMMRAQTKIISVGEKVNQGGKLVKLSILLKKNTHKCLMKKTMSVKMVESLLTNKLKVTPLSKVSKTNMLWLIRIKLELSALQISKKAL